MALQPWYEPIEELTELMVLNSMKEVVEQASDSFLLFPRLNVGSGTRTFTVFCKSWSIGDNVGRLRLPTPQDGVVIHRLIPHPNNSTNTQKDASKNCKNEDDSITDGPSDSRKKSKKSYTKIKQSTNEGLSTKKWGSAKQAGAGSMKRKATTTTPLPDDFYVEERLLDVRKSLTEITSS